MSSHLQQSIDLPGQAPVRSWLASLDLNLQWRNNKTALVRAAHKGPLRVQRPFYPEKDGCCHVYLLHPPGGLVIGDDLRINALVEEASSALITTPSAGKIYGAEGFGEKQRQSVHFQVGKNASMEWLPQETIVFDSANGHLHTRIDIEQSSKFLAWDIVRLGRRASGERFTRGRCVQKFEVYKNGLPIFIENNCIDASSKFQSASWGMRDAHTFGTLLASVDPQREAVDEWLEVLDAQSDSGGAGLWGLTQKDELFVARYLGNSITQCRAGMQYLWQQLRPIGLGKEAVHPRIWNT